MLNIMTDLLGRKNPYAQVVHGVYASALSFSRSPKFYQEYSVPDTLDGRFDLLLLTVFLVMQRMLDEQTEGSRKVAKKFNQALFDETFKDMDQTLREMGIGDMGVPKHMRKMMRAFNGRMHAYENAITTATLKDALIKNLYGTIEAPDESSVVKMEQKIYEVLECLKAQKIEDLLAGRIEFEKE